MWITLEYGSSSTGMIVISNLSPCCNIDDEPPIPVIDDPDPTDVYFFNCDLYADYTNCILPPKELLELCYNDYREFDWADDVLLPYVSFFPDDIKLALF